MSFNYLIILIVLFGLPYHVIVKKDQKGVYVLRGEVVDSKSGALIENVDIARDGKGIILL